MLVSCRYCVYSYIITATNTSQQATNMKKEILAALRTFGFQPTTALTFAFGSEFSKAIKQLHNEGKVRKHKNGWEAV